MALILMGDFNDAWIAPIPDFITTDHRPTLATFDTKTATKPVSKATLRRYKIKSKRIMTRRATAEDWEAYTSELTATTDPPRTDTAPIQVDINELWGTIRDRVHTTAHNTLPVQKVGRIARVPCEQQRLAHSAETAARAHTPSSPTPISTSGHASTTKSANSRSNYHQMLRMEMPNSET
ncbi:hypothetical protein BGZ83_002031 [Gryganskiella cystojenkinii]|nr:hypothetical protein BGZ83_002031 [Gryganskiella cystojenkinii]